MTNREKTTVITFYQLKSCYQGGVVLNYKAQYLRIAASFGFSASKLREYVRHLLASGWARTSGPKGRHLELIATKRFAEQIGCKSLRYARIDLSRMGQLKEELTKRVLENSLQQQAYRVWQKNADQRICALVGIKNPSHLAEGRFKRVRKHLCSRSEMENLRLIDLPRYESHLPWHFKANPQPAGTINPDVTLSRRAVAALFNYRSTASAQRLVKGLVKVGLLNDQPRLRRLILPDETGSGVSYAYYQQFQRHVLEYDGRYRFMPLRDGSGNGFICRQLPNLLSFPVATT
jgi:hypothetical protein